MKRHDAASFDVAIIGAGVFGAWTAWHLTRAGKSVLLIDAWGAGHSRSSSGDETRIIRVGYGADEIYTQMAIESLAQWRELFDRTGRALFHRTGVLRLSRDADAYSAASRATLERAGARYEMVAREELARRWPQMQYPGGETYGLFEPDSGTLMARRSVAAVVEDAVAHGAQYAVRSMSWPPSGIDARTYVYACGPWLPKLFPELLARRIRVTRQEIFYFAPPAGNPMFAPPHMPAWVDFADPRGPYGIPDIEARGIKLGFDLHGEAFDPDAGSREITREGITWAREFLAERFPDLAEAPLTESRVCQYSNTSSGDFLIDRHPAEPNVWLIGGGSGHGFKHGPSVGEYAASQILGVADPEPRFSFATKLESPQRTVY
jgi:glycine/D-amino acid oxidase-like deaminating enzyme